MCCCFNRTQIRGLLQGFSFARTAPPCPASYGLVSGDGTSAVEHSHLLVAISLEDTAGESKGRRPHPSPLHAVERAGVRPPAVSWRVRPYAREAAGSESRSCATSGAPPSWGQCPFFGRSQRSEVGKASCKE